MSAANRFALVALLAASALSSTTAADENSDGGPLALFEQRIMPIFKSPEPSSCVQCHLAAVDLKDYILPSHEQTFVSLRDQGLIDLEQPEKSKILSLIQMGEDDLDKGARLIHAQTRQAEYEAFAAWIKACCEDPQLRALPSADDSQQAGPEAPDEVIRHARKSRIVDSFVRNVWSQRMRCYPCHTPHEIDHTNPKHQKAIERAEAFVEQYGERMNIFRETPEATIRHLIESSRDAPADELPLINLENPAKSLLVLKPTSKLPEKLGKGRFAPPSYSEPVSHMGGLKMHRDDYSYKAFVAWIQDYARVVGDKYATTADLPQDNWIPTRHILILRDAPTQWPDFTPVQLFVHRWNEEAECWEPGPIAFTQGMVTPRRMVNGALFLLASNADRHALKRSTEKATLPPGRYLIRAYVDKTGQIADDPIALLNDDDCDVQIEIVANWGEGYPNAEHVSAGQLADPQ